MTLKEFFSPKRHKQIPAKLPPGQSMQFALFVWLINFAMAVFLFSWIFELLRLPEKYFSFYTIVFSYGLIKTGLIFLLIYHYKLTQSDVGLKPAPRPHHRLISLLLSGMAIISLLNLCYMAISGFFTPGSFNWSSHKGSDIVMALAVAPIFEELFYRGCLQAIFLKRFKSKIKAVFLSALLFALAHFEVSTKKRVKGLLSFISTTEKTDGRKTLVSFALPVDILASGIIYGSFYLLGGNNITVPMTLHGFDNVLGLVRSEWGSGLSIYQFDIIHPCPDH